MKILKKLNIKYFFSIFGLVALLIGCEKVKNEPQNEQNKVIKVLISPDNPPMTYAEQNDTEIVYKGFEVELAELIGNELGIKIEIIPTTFEGIIAGLQSNGDMAISAITPTEQRSLSVNFSKPYANAEIILISKGTSGLDVKDALNKKKVGVQAGTFMHHYINTIKMSDKSIDFEILMFDTINSLIAAFESDNVDVIVIDSLTKIKNHSHITVNTNKMTEYCIAFNKNSSISVDLVNEILDKKSEQINELKTKYGIKS